jgi:serine/threonine protein phosphatase 1
MMLRTRDEPETAHTWLSLGGLATLDSYALHGFRGGISAIPQSHWQFLEEQTVAYWETEREIFVHATLDPELDMAAQPDFLLFWERFSSPTVHKSGKQIVCGHTSQRSGLPAVFEGGVCIDTWVYGPGWLTCFDITGRTFTQANQRGQLRTLDLARLNAP